MLRSEDLSEITDGKKYGLNDMVRADAMGCKGCSKCCETMADTIVLGPIDIYRLSRATKTDFNGLLAGSIELNMQDGIILPNIKSSAGGCVFLKDKRCSIHSERPDFCRLFPLGRLYENGDFTYILQVNECDMPRSKVKVKKWIDTPDYDKNAAYIIKWHDIITGVREKVCQGLESSKSLLMMVLKVFYQDPYDINSDFYEQFNARVDIFEEFINNGI